MPKTKYHHGDLKKELIRKGLQLLNKEGYEGFSLRKVAVMCGVSHAAPYKHFQDKEELIAAITQEVLDSFRLSLEEVPSRFPDDPVTQIVELGKAYVRFMVENPEYLKFIFLNNNNTNSPRVTKQGIFENETDIFMVFYKGAVNYLKAVGAEQVRWTVDIMTMWSMVHGMAFLITNHSLQFEGDYLELVETMLKDYAKAHRLLIKGS